MWPQVTVLVLLGISLLLTANLHGKERTGKHDFLTTLISTGLTFWLLWQGGFFRNWGR